MIMKRVTLLFKRLPHGEGLPLPRQQTEGSAGMDIRSAEDNVIVFGDTRVIRTGLCVAVPRGFLLDVRTRSGHAKQGVVVTNSPGLVDSDYRGEIMVIMTNNGAFDFSINRGDRIAQLVLLPSPAVEVIEVEALDATERGENGLGSTGVR